MTIKVCRNKFEDNLEKIGESVEKIGETVYLSLQIILPLLFGISLYLYSLGEFLAPLYLALSGMFTMTLYVMVFIFSDENIFSLVNEKLKLFEWDEDC